MKLKSGHWVLVADGARGLILENEGTAAEPQLRVIRHFDQHTPKTSELGDAKPGRTFESVGTRRSATEAPDLHQRAEDRFVTMIMHEIAKEASADSFEKIVIVAPPVALGEMRKAVANGLKDRITAWIDKDLTKEPIPAITKSVIKALEG